MCDLCSDNPEVRSTKRARIREAVVNLRKIADVMEDRAERAEHMTFEPHEDWAARQAISGLVHFWLG